MNVIQADRHRLEAIIADRSAKHVWRGKIILVSEVRRETQGHCSNRSLTCNLPSTASSPIPMPIPNHSSEPPTQNALAAVKRGNQALESVQ